MRIFSNRQIIILLFIIISLLIVLRRKKSEGMQDSIAEDGTITPGYGITSKNGQHRLEFGVSGGLKIVSMPDSNGEIKTEWVYDPGEKFVTQPKLKFDSGNLSILDDKDKTSWSNEFKSDDSGFKLIMDDDGILKIRNKMNVIVWQFPKPETKIKEGMAKVSDYYVTFKSDYDANIKNKRDDLNRKVDTLKNLPDQSKRQRDASTMRFILWVTLASSMAFFLLYGS